jgi:hypothetical protein
MSAAVSLPPWVGSGEQEAEMRQKILALSEDSRNVLLAPPEGNDFKFDISQYRDTAQALLRADGRLEQLRFELVPKEVTEETFWRNYFYRVSLIKRSIHFTTAATNKSASPLAGGNMGSASAVSQSAPPSPDQKVAAISQSAPPSPDDQKMIPVVNSAPAVAIGKSSDDGVTQEGKSMMTTNNPSALTTSLPAREEGDKPVVDESSDNKEEEEDDDNDEYHLDLDIDTANIPTVDDDEDWEQALQKELGLDE